MNQPSGQDERPTGQDESEKFDHSGHPVDRPEPGDLRAPGGGGAERLERRDGRRAVVPPLDTERPKEASALLSGRRNARVRRLDSRGSTDR